MPMFKPISENEAAGKVKAVFDELFTNTFWMKKSVNVAKSWSLHATSSVTHDFQATQGFK